MKFGVIRFPGSCDETDAVLACERVPGASATLLWHGDKDLQGVEAVVVPGGFSYGDYLRCGAIARFSPVMESVIRFSQEGGLVLGICNGFQVLCEAGLLPGALRPNASLSFVCRDVPLVVERTETPFNPACPSLRQSPTRPSRPVCLSRPTLLARRLRHSTTSIARSIGRPNSASIDVARSLNSVG